MDGNAGSGFALRKVPLAYTYKRNTAPRRFHGPEASRKR